MMDEIGAKILAGFLLFFLAFLFGWMPFFCFRRYFKHFRSTAAHRSENKQPLMIQCLHSFASGVLLATSLLHLLPESLQAVKEAISSENSQKPVQITPDKDVINITDLRKVKLSNGQELSRDGYFPVAECLVALGFLFIYFIDSAIKSCSKPDYIQSYLDYGADENLISSKADSESSRHDITAELRGAPESHGKYKQIERLLARRHKTKPSLQLSLLKSTLSKTSRESIEGSQSKLWVDNNSVIETDVEDSKEIDNDQQMHSSTEPENKTFVKLSSSVELHPLAVLTKTGGSAKSSQFRSVALVSALCIHGFFDGVMLGLQTSLSVIMSLLLALSIHKSFVAIGLSLSLLGSSDKKVSYTMTLLYIFLFALVAPLGLLLSAAFLHRSFETCSDCQISLVPGCLQAFAVGTFLYVAFTETTERRHRRRLCVLIVCHLCLLVGFGLMAGLRAVVGST